MRNPYRGDTKRYLFTFQDSGGSPVDITDWTIWFTLKEDEDLDDTHAAVQVSSTAGDDAEDSPALGTMFLEVFYDCPAGSYSYDFQRVIAGKATTLDKGQVSIKQDVTKDV